MPSGTCCAPVVHGVCCLTTCRPGNRSTTTFGFGGEMEPGRGFTMPCSPRCPAPHDALLPTMPCSPRCPAPHDALLPTMPCSPRCPAPHDALLPTMPCSPRCPAPHDALLPTMPCSPRCPAPHDALLPTMPCSPRCPAPHDAPHDALLPTMPCSPRCPAPHDALLPTMPCSPRCPAPHDALLPTMPCSPRCPAPHDALLPTMRRFLGRQPSPSGAIIDSQSVKTTERRPRKKGASGVRRGQAGERPQTAYCGGYPGTAVGGGGAPSRHARPGWGQAGHQQADRKVSPVELDRLSLIWADGGYAGKLIEWVATLTGWTLELVRRPGNSHSFEVLPRRWVVERTFAWLGRHRRLSKDYEALPETTEAWVYTAMTRLMLRRLARPTAF